VRTNRLAYSSGANDSNIWRIELRGPSGNPSPPTQLIASTHSDNQPAYSPDGKRIAFVSDRSGASELWVSDGDGANPTQLTFQGRMIMGPRWSWDGKHLAFFGRRLGDPLEAFVISASGGEPRRIEGTPSGSKWPYWSRDGKWVYIATDGENAIRKIALAGGQSIRIAPTGDVPQESPDGKYIYFHTGWPNPMTIWRTGINGGEPAKILESVHSSGNWTVTEKGIYFFRVADEKGHSELCLYEFSTGRTKTLTSITNGIEYAVAAPPEGNVIAYSQLDVAGSDLMLVENFR
jgi:TolB protein